MNRLKNLHLNKAHDQLLGHRKWSSSNEVIFEELFGMPDLASVLNPGIPHYGMLGM